MERCVKTLQGDYSSFSGLFPESGDFYKQTEAISEFGLLLDCLLKWCFIAKYFLCHRYSFFFFYLYFSNLILKWGYYFLESSLVLYCISCLCPIAFFGRGALVMLSWYLVFEVIYHFSYFVCMYAPMYVYVCAHADGWIFSFLVSF